jgi:hypothetical protein
MISGEWSTRVYINPLYRYCGHSSLRTFQAAQIGVLIMNRERIRHDLLNANSEDGSNAYLSIRDRRLTSSSRELLADRVIELPKRSNDT